jgi:porin
VTFDLFFVADLQANPVGGLKQTEAGWGRIRGTMDIDFGRLTDWNGLTFHVTGLWQFGGNLGAQIGTIANPSGLVSAHTTRLDSFWLQQAFLHNHLFVKAGQLAGLDFYGNQTYGASYVIEPLDYAYGNLFTNTFESFNPAGTPGVQVRVQPTHDLYFTAAVISGNRDPYQQDKTGLNFVIKDSPVFLYEVGYAHGMENSAGQLDKKMYPGTFKLGAAYNGGKFANAAGVRSSANYLIYGAINQALYRAAGAGSDRGLDATIGFDWSPNDVNRQNSQITGGLRYKGLIPGRAKDWAAFGFVYSKISDQFRFAEASIGLPPLGSEKALEFNYGLQLTPYFLVQPVFQYYVDIGANPRVPNAAVFGFRTKVTF